MDGHWRPECKVTGRAHWASLEFSAKEQHVKMYALLSCNYSSSLVKIIIIFARGFKPYNLSHLSIDFIDCYVDK